MQPRQSRYVLGISGLIRRLNLSPISRRRFVHLGQEATFRYFLFKNALSRPRQARLRNLKISSLRAATPISPSRIILPYQNSKLMKNILADLPFLFSFFLLGAIATAQSPRLPLGVV